MNGLAFLNLKTMIVSERVKFSALLNVAQNKIFHSSNSKREEQSDHHMKELAKSLLGGFHSRSGQFHRNMEQAMQRRSFLITEQ
jgi:hypothetical protein